MTDMPTPELGVLHDLGWISPDEPLACQPLSGGVSADVWKVETQRGPVCVKRSRPKLRVESDWRAPVERTEAEAAWLRTVARVAPDAVPAVIAEDRVRHSFVMAYLDPETHPVWKSRLMAGHVDESVAAEVGRRLASIHGATADDTVLARAFTNGRTFDALRITPYFRAAAEANPDCRAALDGVITLLRRNQRALIHGDISPKNILVGPNGPVFIDAECATYGDPTFDVAFCLNHLALKCVAVPNRTEALIESCLGLADSYLSGVSWEAPADIDRRVAAVLPALMLARLDGQSPVEYINRTHERTAVRSFAKEALRTPYPTVRDLVGAWRQIVPIAETVHG